MYKEKPIPQHWPWILVGIFGCTLIPNAWLPELSTDEAMHAMIARDLHDYLNVFSPSVMGVQTSHPPLLAWILGILSLVMPLNEFTVRIVDILCLGGSCWIAGHLINRLIGRHAAAVTVAAIFSSAVALQKGRFGEGHMLFMLLINLAWLLLYQLSREQKQWWRAWLVSHGIVFVAMLAGGPKALFYFYLPLLILKRPFKVRRRMRQWEHLASLALLLTLSVVWVSLVPGMWETIFAEIQGLPKVDPADGYFRRFILFPFRAILGYLPWIFLVWPAFCQAWRPIEKESVLAHYLRTIVLCLFWFFWLVPEGKPSYLLPAIVPLGMLTGIHYDILVRRHGEKLQSLNRIILYMAFLLSFSGLVMIALHRVDYGLLTKPVWLLWSCAFFVLSGLGVAFWDLRKGGSLPIWLRLGLAIMAFHLIWVSTIGAHVYVMHGKNRAKGRLLTNAVPAEQPVYFLDRWITESRLSLVAECFYLGRLVVKIDHLQDITNPGKTLYVLCKDRPTGLGNWEWEPIGESVTYDELTLKMWRGTDIGQ